MVGNGFFIWEVMMIVTFLNKSLVFEVEGRSAVLISSSLDRATASC